ncbi:MAG: hypothetical protein Q9M92_03380 [Enterobacterales bacterium]|nr:hypothetical protein [Enterobacterales bacterium]
MDFCNRIDLKKANRRCLEALIKAGALDKLGPDRAILMASLEQATKSAEQFKRNRELGQNDLFGIPTEQGAEQNLSFTQVRPWPESRVLEGEKEYLGLYLTGHPIDRYLPEIKKFCQHRLNALQPTRRGDHQLIAGLIINVRVMKTKKGLNWAIVTLDDQSARLDLMVFSELYESSKDILIKDQVIVAKGDISTDDYSSGLKMSVVNVQRFVDLREERSQYLEIAINFNVGAELAEELLDTIKPYKGGRCPVRLTCDDDNFLATFALPGDWSVKPEDNLLYNLKSLPICGKIELLL